MLEIYCPTCTKWFKSRLLQVDAVTFKSGTFYNNTEPCPFCDHDVTHDKKYMRLVEENGNIITLE